VSAVDSVCSGVVASGSGAGPPSAYRIRDWRRRSRSRSYQSACSGSRAWSNGSRAVARAARCASTRRSARSVSASRFHSRSRGTPTGCTGAGGGGSPGPEGSRPSTVIRALIPAAASAARRQHSLPVSSAI
jgi:hypothetical protein